MVGILHMIDLEQELIDDFWLDASEVIKNLNVFLSSYKGPEDTHYFEKYGQQIDRIMGAALTISLLDIGDLARMGKEIGYKSSQLNDPHKLHAIHSLLYQILRKIEYAMKLLQKRRELDKDEVEDLLHKLRMANQQLGDLRTTVALNA